MRVPFLFGIKTGYGKEIINSYENINYSNGILVHNNFEFNIDFIAQYNSTWNIYYILSKKSDAGQCTKIYRKLRRCALIDSDKLLGPFSIQRAYVLYPSFANRWLKIGIYDENDNWIEPANDILVAPRTYLGEDPEKAALIDYSPTDAQCINDEESQYE